MTFTQIIAFSVICTVAVIALRQHNGEVALLLGVGGGIIVILSILDQLFDVAYTFYNLADQTGIESGLFTTVLKIIGMGYLTEFTASLCKDAAVNSIAEKVLFAGKICITVVALPLMIDLAQLIVSVLPQ